MAELDFRQLFLTLRKATMQQRIKAFRDRLKFEITELKWSLESTQYLAV